MTVSVAFESRNTVKYEGVAADTKPTPDVKFTNAWFKATDTFERWVWNGNTWKEAHVGRFLFEFRLDVDAVRPGSTPPGTEVTESVGASGNIKIPTLAFDPGAGGDEEIFFILHVGEHADAMVDVEFHLMWKPDTNWTSGDYHWSLEYLVKAQNEDSSLGTPTTISESVTPANANDFIETEFSNLIDADADELIFCHLFLDKSETAADEDGHVFFVEVQFTADKLGELFE